MKVYILTPIYGDMEGQPKWFMSRKLAEQYLKANNIYNYYNVVECEFGQKIVTVTAVAGFYGIPRNTVLNWIKAGHIKAFRIGHKWMIEASTLPSFNSGDDIDVIEEFPTTTDDLN